MPVWLCQIAKHAYFAQLRKEKRRSGQPVEEALETAPHLSVSFVEQQPLDESDAMTLHQYLHNLPEPYKEVFMLRVFGELSFRKIAQIFGKTESWARITYFTISVVSETRNPYSSRLLPFPKSRFHLYFSSLFVTFPLHTSLVSLKIIPNFFSKLS